MVGRYCKTSERFCYRPCLKVYKTITDTCRAPFALFLLDSNYLYFFQFSIRVRLYVSSIAPVVTCFLISFFCFFFLQR